MSALYWSAIINGALAPVLLAAILALATDRKIMQGQPVSRLNRATVAVTTLFMFGALVGMFV